MRTYIPNGPEHRLLARLISEPASFVDLVWSLQIAGQKRRDKLFRTLSAMRHHGLVRRDGPETYAIGTGGIVALETLRRGEPYEVGEAVPNVRIFGARAA